MGNTKIENVGIHHIALAAADFDRTVAFYCEGLGCTVYRQWGEGDQRAIMLDIGNGIMLEVFANGTKECEQNGKWVHLAIKTSDPDAAYANALAAGAVVKTPPADVTIQSKPAPLDVRIAFVYGPSGEVIEFFQTK